MTDSSTGPASKSKPGNVSRILRLFRPYWYRVLVVGLLILITSGLGVVNPLLIKVVFDSALFPSEGGPDLRLLWMIVAVMAVIAVVSGGLGIVQTYITNKVGPERHAGPSRLRLRSPAGMSLGFFTGTRTGEVQSRISNDVGGVQTVVTSTVSDTIANVVILTSTLIAMLILSWQLTAVAVATAPVSSPGQVGRLAPPESSSPIPGRDGRGNGSNPETLSVSGIMLAKLFGRQNQEIEHFHQTTRNSRIWLCASR